MTNDGMDQSMQLLVRNIRVPMNMVGIKVFGIFFLFFSRFVFLSPWRMHKNPLCQIKEETPNRIVPVCRSLMPSSFSVSIWDKLFVQLHYEKLVKSHRTNNAQWNKRHIFNQSENKSKIRISTISLFVVLSLSATTRNIKKNLKKKTISTLIEMRKALYVIIKIVISKRRSRVRRDIDSSLNWNLCEFNCLSRMLNLNATYKSQIPGVSPTLTCHCPPVDFVYEKKCLCIQQSYHQEMMCSCWNASITTETNRWNPISRDKMYIHRHKTVDYEW